MHYLEMIITISIDTEKYLYLIEDTQVMRIFRFIKLINMFPSIVIILIHGIHLVVEYITNSFKTKMRLIFNLLKVIHKYHSSCV